MSVSDDRFRRIFQAAIVAVFGATVVLAVAGVTLAVVWLVTR